MKNGLRYLVLAATVLARLVGAEDLLFLADFTGLELYVSTTGPPFPYNFSYKTVGNTEWLNMTTEDFKKYKAIIIGDPIADTPAYLATLVQNRQTWSAAVEGNVILIGTDTAHHYYNSQDLMSNGVAFAASGNSTGLYFSLSRYYGNSNETAVQILDQFGTFDVRGDLSTERTDGEECYDEVHIVAKNAVLNNITDTVLSNWSCSVHEAFTKWPSTGSQSFVPLAIAQGVTGAGVTSFSDGTSGIPYILVRGATPIGCGNGKLDPGEECDDGNLVNGDGCNSACRFEHGSGAAGTKKAQAGPIAGGVVGGLAAVAVLGGLAFLLYTKYIATGALKGLTSIGSGGASGAAGGGHGAVGATTMAQSGYVPGVTEKAASQVVTQAGQAVQSVMPVDPSSMAGHAFQSTVPVDPSSMAGHAFQSTVPVDPSSMAGHAFQSTVPVDPSSLAGSQAAQSAIPVDPSSLTGSAQAAQAGIPVDPTSLGGSAQAAQSAIPVDPSSLGASQAAACPPTDPTSIATAGQAAQNAVPLGDPSFGAVGQAAQGVIGQMGQAATGALQATQGILGASAGNAAQAAGATMNGLTSAGAQVSQSGAAIGTAVAGGFGGIAGALGGLFGRKKKDRNAQNDMEAAYMPTPPAAPVLQQQYYAQPQPPPPPTYGYQEKAVEQDPDANQGQNLDVGVREVAPTPGAYEITSDPMLRMDMAAGNQISRVDASSYQPQQYQQNYLPQGYPPQQSLYYNYNPGGHPL